MSALRRLMCCAALAPTFYLLLGASGVLAQTHSAECININTARREELMRLPYVGSVMAERIVAYRSKHGPFKRPQDIIIIRGMSAKRYRAIARLICPLH